jgi:metal-sulfur cluster biosynthetic enzyme
MATVTSAQVLEALKTVYDPELPGISIVDLGLVYDVHVDDDANVQVKMTLTTPGCGMARMIVDEARSKVTSVEGVKSGEVEIVWEPQWNIDMISDDARKKLGYA